MITMLIPNRKTRRTLSGKRCTMCGLAIHSTDLALVLINNDQHVLHQQCTNILAENIAAKLEEEEVDAATE